MLAGVRTQPAVAPPPGNPRFPLIDALRAIAALSIFVLHAGVAFAGPNAWYAPYVSRLDIGVTIFFLISGFLLYRPFVAARLDRAPRPRVLDYAQSRALRILPAYWLALTVLAIYPGLTGVFDRGGWHYYLLLQEYFPHWTYGGLSQAWSLSVEVSFYAALPLIALAAGRLVAGRQRPAQLRRELLLLGGLYVFSLAFRLAVTGGSTPDFLGLPARYTIVPGSVVTSLLGTLDWFALGMLLAVASVALEGRPRPAPIRAVERYPSLFWGAALALFVGGIELGLFPDFPDRFTPAQWYAGQAVYGLIGLLLLLPTVFGGELGGLPRHVLRNRVLAWLGLISYGIFLWHVPIVDELAKRDSPGLLLLAIALAITVACAATSYYGFERPLLRLKHRRLRGRPRQGVAAGLGTATRGD
jgi:peptidoglycan/LPS O-acetylase OafA/YrhL